MFDGFSALYVVYAAAALTGAFGVGSLVGTAV